VSPNQISSGMNIAQGLHRAVQRQPNAAGEVLKRELGDRYTAESRSTQEQ
jgi:hypothetical protein